MSRNSYLGRLAQRTRTEAYALAPPRGIPPHALTAAEPGFFSESPSAVDHAPTNAHAPQRVLSETPVVHLSHPSRQPLRSAAKAAHTPTFGEPDLTPTLAPPTRQPTAASTVAKSAPTPNEADVPAKRTQVEVKPAGIRPATSRLPTKDMEPFEPTLSIDAALRTAFQWVSDTKPEEERPAAPATSPPATKATQPRQNVTAKADNIRAFIEPRRPPEAVKAEPPRHIHIGRIEVHVEPAKAPHAPAPTVRQDERRATENKPPVVHGALSRGCASIIGLRQS